MNTRRGDMEAAPERERGPSVAGNSISGKYMKGRETRDLNLLWRGLGLRVMLIA